MLATLCQPHLRGNGFVTVNDQTPAEVTWLHDRPRFPRN